MRLNGKLCVITATGGSMGRTAAIGFGPKGATVVGCDSNPDAAQESLQRVLAAGGRIASFQVIPRRTSELWLTTVEVLGGMLL